MDTIINLQEEKELNNLTELIEQVVSLPPDPAAKFYEKQDAKMLNSIFVEHKEYLDSHDKIELLVNLVDNFPCNIEDVALIEARKIFVLTSNIFEDYILRADATTDSSYTEIFSKYINSDKRNDFVFVSENLRDITKELKDCFISNNIPMVSSIISLELFIAGDLYNCIKKEQP